MKHLLLFLVFLSLLNSCKKSNNEATEHPYVEFTFHGSGATVPAQFTFTCNLNSPYEIKWDFGDGTTGTGNPVTHTYTEMGFYKVYVTAKSNEGFGGAVNNVNVSPYTKMQIHQVNCVAHYVQPNGSTWDPEPGVTNPDLYVKIFSSAGIELTGTNGYAHAPDVISVPYPINPVIDITDFDGTFKLQLLDYDLGNPQDQIVGTFNCRPADFFRPNLNFASQMQKIDPATNAIATIFITWLN